MRHDFLDRWSRLDSPVHRIAPAWKLGLALLTIIVTVTVPRNAPWAYVTVGVLLALVTFLSRIPPAFVIGRVLLLEPLVLGVALLSVFQPDGTTIALCSIVKSTLCLATMILLTSTTPFADLLEVLRRAGLPSLLVTVLALMYRYLFVLADETERMQRARASRSFTNRRDQAWRNSTSLIGQLFVRSTERAERIYAAMCARGWQ